MGFLTGLWIVIISFFISWGFNWLFKNVLLRLVKKTRSHADDKIVNAIEHPLMVSVVLGALLWVMKNNGEVGSLTLNFSRLIMTALMLWWSLAIIKISDALLDEMNHRLNHKHDIMSFFKSLSRWGWLGAALVAILFIWHIDVSPLLAAGGVVGIAVAFAAKDTIANIFGGISVFLDKPFKIGDYIVLGENERGEVISIGARTTKIRTRDDVLISIPNSIMSNTKIVNETGLNPRLRIRVMIGMPYDCDLGKAERTLYMAISKVDHILVHPEPRIRFREFADSAINAEVMGWVKAPADKGRVTHEVIKQIKSDLDSVGIAVPFPQRDVHVYKVKS